MEKCLIQLTLDWPYGNYHGPKLFDIQICKLSVAKKLKKFLKNNKDVTFSYHLENDDLDVPYSAIKLTILTDQEVMNAFELLNENDLRVSSAALFDTIKESREQED